MSLGFDLAFAAAKAAAAAGETPVGAAVIGPDGAALAVAHNLTEALRDPSAHAEMLAMRAAAWARGGRLLGCDLYVTLEPCAMCAAAISHMRVRRLYFGAYDVKGGAVDHGPRWFEQSTCLWRPELYGGFREHEAAALLRAFFSERR